jgi:hypothetical protein
MIEDAEGCGDSDDPEDGKDCVENFAGGPGNKL